MTTRTVEKVALLFWAASFLSILIAAHAMVAPDYFMKTYIETPAVLLLIYGVLVFYFNKYRGRRGLRKLLADYEWGILTASSLVFLTVVINFFALRYVYATHHIHKIEWLIPVNALWGATKLHDVLMRYVEER